MLLPMLYPIPTLEPYKLLAAKLVAKASSRDCSSSVNVSLRSLLAITLLILEASANVPTCLSHAIGSNKLFLIPRKAFPMPEVPWWVFWSACSITFTASSSKPRAVFRFEYRRASSGGVGPIGKAPLPSNALLWLCSRHCLISSSFCDPALQQP